MKLHVVLGTLLGISCFATGCGPGLGHHGRWAEAPVSTTTLTSADLPAARLDASDPWGKSADARALDDGDPWSDAPEAATAAAPRTWGTDAPKE